MRSLLLFLTTAHSESDPPVDKTAIDVIHTAEDKSLHGAASHLVTSQKHELDEAKSLLFDAIEAFGKVKDALSLSAGELVDCSVIGHLGISKIKEAEKAIHHPKNPPGVVEAENYLKEAMKKHDQLNTLAVEIHKSYTALRADLHKVETAIKAKKEFLEKSLTVKDEEITEESLRQMAAVSGGYKAVDDIKFELSYFCVLKNQ